MSRLCALARALEPPRAPSRRRTASARAAAPMRLRHPRGRLLLGVRGQSATVMGEGACGYATRNACCPPTLLTAHPQLPGEAHDESLKLRLTLRACRDGAGEGLTRK